MRFNAVFFAISMLVGFTGDSNLCFADVNPAFALKNVKAKQLFPDAASSYSPLRVENAARIRMGKH
jgi:hypothetical protein